MKLKDLKIGTQLLLSFAVMSLLVIVLGVVSFRQANEIHLQTETIYNHPLQVKSAIGKLNVDILTMRLATRDLMLAINDKEKQDALQSMELSSEDAGLRFKILKETYLGPTADVDEAHEAFVRWKTVRQDNTRLALAENDLKVKESISSTGTVGILRDKMLAKIKTIDDFATRKGEFLYANTNELKDTLDLQLLFIVIAILLLKVLIGFLLKRNIQNPIVELMDVTRKFQDGDMNVRSQLVSKNEFGALANSFNTMVEKIQINSELNQKTTNLSQIMLLEEEPHKFFASVLPVIAEQTNSQIAAVYLLSENKKRFEHFESFDMSNSSKLTFDVDKFEGEFGSVLSTQKVQTIKQIPKDTRFLFHTVSGKLVPREIISIPIISGKEIIAIISLASVRTYLKQSTLLIENVLDTLTARIEGVLSYQRIQNFSKTLEFQNRELEAQKIEMEAQSIELTERNRELE